MSHTQDTTPPHPATEQAPGPLQGLRVVEFGHAVAGPFATVMLADLGAEVIKIERPGVGDSLRGMGPRKGGVGLWWSVAGRNKRSITIDLQKPEGLALARDVIARSDVVVENFRPGVMERLGLGWDELRALNPDLVLLRISGFGQTGPYAGRGGFGKIAEAFSGATNLTGDPSTAPVHPGYSLGDATCGLMGAFAVLAALRAKDSGVAGGQVIDLGLYEPVFRLIDWQLPVTVTGDVPITRSGPKFPFDAAFVTTICRTSDEGYVVVSAATAATIQRLAEFLAAESGRPVTTGAATTASAGRLTDEVEAWCAAQPAERVIELLSAAGVVCGPVLRPDEIMKDPQYAARENIVEIEDARIGTLTMPGVVPRFSETPGEVRWAGRELGEDTDAVLRALCGLSDARIGELREAGVL
ncbi:CaiB/BaiF CoA transferase family protein [Pseudonocardia pini]|uniref:CaiB/BaiF CoA transferase family protein n=1 Tax=Pseudonocardia pini TaxID=2758030 RepID=UPI0015F02C55|nr:CoA transferase [Pseudonocardia pini]